MKSEVVQITELNLNSASKSFLREIAGWTKFLAILGFVFVGLLVLIAIFAGTIYSSVLGALAINSAIDFGLLMTAVYLIVALIYFFPILFLYKFSVRLKKALQSKEDEDLTGALEMLKSHYKFIGVFTIIVLSLYVLAIIAGMMGVFI